MTPRDGGISVSLGCCGIPSSQKGSLLEVSGQAGTHRLHTKSTPSLSVWPPEVPFLVTPWRLFFEGWKSPKAGGRGQQGGRKGRICCWWPGVCFTSPRPVSLPLFLSLPALGFLSLQPHPVSSLCLLLDFTLNYKWRCGAHLLWLLT